MIRHLVLWGLSAMAIGSAPVAASAAAATVCVDPLELHSGPGLLEFYARLQVAAERSCAALSALDLWTRSARDRCRGEALEAAVRRVGNARLTRLHRSCQRLGSERRCTTAAGSG